MITHRSDVITKRRRRRAACASATWSQNGGTIKRWGGSLPVALQAVGLAEGRR